MSKKRFVFQITIGMEDYWYSATTARKAILYHNQHYRCIYKEHQIDAVVKLDDFKELEVVDALTNSEEFNLYSTPSITKTCGEWSSELEGFICTTDPQATFE